MLFTDSNDFFDKAKEMERLSREYEKSERFKLTIYVGMIVSGIFMII